MGTEINRENSLQALQKNWAFATKSQKIWHKWWEFVG